MFLDTSGDGLARRHHCHYSSISAPLVFCYLVMISSSNPVSPPVTIGFSKSSVCLKATVSFTIFSLVHYNLSHCTTSRVQNFATASALPFAPHLCFVTNFCRRHSPSLASCLAGLSVTIYSSDIETAITCQGVYGAKQNRPDLSPSPPAEMTHQQWPCLPPHLGKVIVSRIVSPPLHYVIASPNRRNVPIKHFSRGPYCSSEKPPPTDTPRLSRCSLTLSQIA